LEDWLKVLKEFGFGLAGRSGELQGEGGGRGMKVSTRRLVWSRIVERVNVKVSSS
jgi:hypothetical protein